MTIRFAKALTATLLMLLLSFVSFSALALEFNIDAVEAEKVKLSWPSQVPTQKTGMQLQKAYQLHEGGNVDKGIDLLLKYNPTNPHDKAVIERYVGNFYAQDETQYSKALEMLKSAVNSKQLNYEEHQSSMKLLGDLELTLNHYQNAINTYESWMQFTGIEESNI